MKRAKIMLLAIAAFATVGTALAFKAQKFGNSQYCFKITTVQPLPGECKSGVEEAAAIRPGATVLYYTTTTSFQNCPNATTLACPNQATQFTN